jgi:pimeloyl-[acyl-carrier protein] methyl ester esterase
MMHIVLLRGLAREAAHWLDFPDQLQTQLKTQLGENCQLHLVDFPGCGKYAQQTALTSIADMTEFARNEITALKPETDSLYILGISMGGMVALDWAQRYPHTVRGLVLLNSSAGNHPPWWRLRPAAWPTMVYALLASTQAREARVLKIVSNNKVDYSQHLNQWLYIQRQRPVTRATIITMLRAAAQFRPRQTCIAKGLVLASDTDRMVSVRASEAIARQFHWPISKHPSAGHDLPMDDPHWVATQIATWLAHP